MIKSEVSNLLEIELDNSDDFLKIKETLTRIGIVSVKNKTVYQTCHILHKRGRYYIVHFKEMFMLDGRPSDISEDDYARRNNIAIALEEWDMCSVSDNTCIRLFPTNMGRFKVIKHKDKDNWNLRPKYKIGVKK